MVHGLPTISSTKGVCEGCVLGKHHSGNFDKDKSWCAQEKLQRVHNDIRGPLETPSLSCVFYFISFIDDYNMKTWVYFLKHKSDTYVVFQEFKTLVEK